MPHKSNMHEAQLATNWPYSSHFYAQFPSWRKQAKWNVSSESNQKQIKDRVWPLDWTLVWTASHRQVKGPTHTNQKHKHGCCLKATFKIFHKCLSPIGHEGRLQEPHTVPVGGELRRSDKCAPPQEPRHGCNTQERLPEFQSNDALLQWGPFQCYRCADWRDLGRRLGDKYKSNQVSQTLHVKKKAPL